MGRTRRERLRVEDCFEFDFDRARKVGDEGIYLWEKALTGEEVWAVKFRLKQSFFGAPLFEITDVEDDGYGADGELFALEHTETPVGMRPYLICNRCGRRIKKLYATHVEGQFQCRTCHDLVYDQQADRNKLRHNIQRMSLYKLQDKIEKATPGELKEILEIITSEVADVALDEPWYRSMQRMRYGKKVA